MEQNAHLPEKELNNIREQLDDFKYYFDDTESSQSLIANLVEETPGFEYGNYNFRLHRSVLEASDEPLVESFYERPVLIASVQDLNESIDSKKLSLIASVSSLNEFIDLK